MNEGPDGLKGRDLVLGPQYRECRGVEVESFDDETRSIRLAFSSEYGVDRGWGIEILSHDTDAADLSRLSAGAAVLVNHDIREHVGVTEDPEIGADRRARVTTRFGSSPKALEIYQDVRDGIRKGVSFMYTIDKARELDPLPAAAVEDGEVEVGWFGVSKKTASERPRVLATRWTPLEVTFASIPADPTVGPGRTMEGILSSARSVAVEWRAGSGSTDESTTEATERGTTLEENTQETPARAKVVEQPVDLDAVRKAARTDENSRIGEIRSWEKRYETVPGIRELAEKAVANGTDVEQFRLSVLDAMPAAEAVRSQIDEDPKIGLTEREIGQFSLRKMLLAQGKQDWREAPFEKECSDAFGQRIGEDARGSWIPPDVLGGSRWSARQRVEKMARAAITAASGGAPIVGLDLRADEFVDVLYNRMILLQMGARVIDGLVGNVSMPKRSAGTTVQWIGEDSAATEDSTTTFAATTRSPKTMSVDIHVTRHMLLQTTPAIEGLLREDVVSSFATALEGIAIKGAGSNEPDGLADTAGIGLVPTTAGAGGAAMDWADVIKLEEEVAIDNADMGTLWYLTNPKVRRHLKEREKGSAGLARFIWDSTEFDQPLNGYPVGVTNNVPSNFESTLSAMFYGNFADLLILTWAGLDLVSDPWTSAAEGNLHVRGFQDVDIHVARPESFAATLDIDTT